MDENTELLKKISKELAEMKTWMRIAALPTIKRAINDNLGDEVSKLVYELSDGTRSTRDIASAVARTKKKITHATVANMWRRWAADGIVVPAARKGRYMKVTSLESLGIAVPEVPIETSETQKEAPTENEKSGNAEDTKHD